MNFQYNGALPPIGTQPSFPYSPLIDNSVAQVKPPQFSIIETRDAACPARAEDHPGFRLKGANKMLFGVFQDWED